MLHFHGGQARRGEAELELGFQTHFVYELVTLLAVLDPTAAIPVFLTATAGLSRRQSIQVAAYAVLSAFLVLVFFIWGGQFLLQALHIPMASFQLAGSIILLLFGVKLVLGQVAEEVAAIPATATMAQRAVYPLAIPTITGAGSMLTVVLLTDNNVRTVGEQILTASRLAISLVVVFAILILAKRIFSLVGRPGIEVMSRVSGLILASIAVNGMVIATKLTFGLT
jgi:multiple antibiotic resistance protein